MALEKIAESIAIVATIDPVKLSTSGGTASTTAATSDVIDMSKFGRCAFIVASNTMAANSQAVCTIYSGTATGTVTTSVGAMTTFAAADDDKQRIYEVDARDLTQGHRYIKAVIVVSPSSGTSASATVCLLALAGEAKYAPANANDLASVASIQYS